MYGASYNFFTRAGLAKDKNRDIIRTDFLHQLENARQAAGVTGTPSIFVDGKIVQPSPNTVPSYSDIQKAIDAAMPK